MRIFLSYREDQTKDFVAEVSYCLRRLAEVAVYFHPDERRSGDFPSHLADELAKSEALALFVSADSHNSEWQNKELKKWLRATGNDDSRLVVVAIEDTPIPLHFKNSLSTIEQVERVRVDAGAPNAAVDCAEQVLGLLKIPRAPFDDLPLGIESSYEKDIISEYVKGRGKLNASLVAKGYPPEWPTISRPVTRDELVENPLDTSKYGEFRADNAAVRVDARTSAPTSLTLAFPEAGPRAEIVKPPNELRAGVLVSGGIAPGINAVIAAIIDRHRIYESAWKKRSGGSRTKIFGLAEGFRALCRDGGDRFKPLDDANVWEHANRGGSVLPTSRADELIALDPRQRETLLKGIVHRIVKDQDLRVLYVIGGEGSMRAAHAVWTVYRQKYPERPLSLICIPKTMDNDILWTWQSFGFLSAVEKARQDVIQLHEEVRSNPRVGVMQLFGSASGFVVSHAALASNVCDLALIPEMEFTMTDVCSYIDGLLSQQLRDGHSPHALIVMAETALPIDSHLYADCDYVHLSREEKDALKEFGESERRVIGQTPNALRTAGLKIVSRVLQRYIQESMGRGDSIALGVAADRDFGPDPYWGDFRVFTNEPRHLIRSVEPSVTEMTYGARLGTMAVDMAMAGYSDCMVSQWLTEYVAVPLKLVVLGRKKLPRNGIFWRNVVAKTGQMAHSSLT